MDRNLDLIDNFHQAMRLMGRGMFSHEEPRHRVHPGQGKLLITLKEMGPSAQKDLVDALDIRPSSLSELLNKLETKELVERRPDEQDKRNSIVSLTEAGEKAAETAAEKYRKLNDRLFGALNSEERSQLNSLLVKLNGSWRETFACDPELHPHPHGPGPMGHMPPGHFGMRHRGGPGCERECD
jgi:DNA-binding MarR family transcriptional regulator